MLAIEDEKVKALQGEKLGKRRVRITAEAAVDTPASRDLRLRVVHAHG